VRIGIVGLSARGGWAATAHLPAIAAVEGLSLSAVTGSSLESARATAEQLGVPSAFGSVADMAASGEVDLVVVAVRVPEHRALIEPALDAGLAVLSEWPLARNAVEADGLRDRAPGVRTAVMLQARVAPAIAYLRDLVADGHVGEALSTDVRVAGGNWGGSTDRSRYYQLDPANGFTMLSGPGGHTLDAVTSVLGDLAEVSATSALRRPWARDGDSGELVANLVPDQIAVTGRLRSGAVLAMHLRGGRPAGPGVRWEIVGTEGTLVLTVDDGLPLIQIGRISLHAGRGAELTPLEVPARYVRVEGVPAAAVNVAHAYLDLRDEAPTPDFAHGARLHGVLAAIETAAATGTTQFLQP
jgi:predicted dehydrogenase